jgi:hypothetical protein
LHVAVGFHTISSPPSISSTSLKSSASFDKPVQFHLWDGATAQEQEIANEILQRTIETGIHFQHDEHSFLDNEEEDEELLDGDTLDVDALHHVLERSDVPYYVLTQDSESHLMEEEHSPDRIVEDKERQQLHQKSSMADTPVLPEMSREKKESFRKSAADETPSHKYENIDVTNHDIAAGETLAAMAGNREVTAETLAEFAEKIPQLLPLAHDQATEVISQTSPVRKEDYDKTQIFLQALGGAARDGAASVLQDIGKGLRWNAVVTMVKSLSNDEKERLLNILQESLDQQLSNTHLGVLEPNENERVSERKLQKEMFVLEELLEKRTQRNKELIVRENDLKFRLERIEEQEKKRMSSTGLALSFQKEPISDEHLMQWELHLDSNKFSSDSNYHFDI